MITNAYPIFFKEETMDFALPKGVYPWKSTIQGYLLHYWKGGRPLRLEFHRMVINQPFGGPVALELKDDGTFKLDLSTVAMPLAFNPLTMDCVADCSQPLQVWEGLARLSHGGINSLRVQKVEDLLIQHLCLWVKKNELFLATLRP
jgi:hypothetical protein